MFDVGTYGTVLGIQFDSGMMMWNLSAEKEMKIREMIDLFLERKTCTLLEAQKLHGKLSDFLLSCDFMLGFRFHIVRLLGKFAREDNPRQKN